MLQSALIGYMQFYLVGEESRNSYGLPADEGLESLRGIDQFIGEVSCWNRGLGARSISLLLQHLFQTMGTLRAVRCYEECGLRKVKILPAHELHEGVVRDSWLVEAASAAWPDIRSGERYQ